MPCWRASSTRAWENAPPQWHGRSGGAACAWGAIPPVPAEAGRSTKSAVSTRINGQHRRSNASLHPTFFKPDRNRSCGKAMDFPAGSSGYTQPVLETRRFQVMDRGPFCFFQVLRNGSQVISIKIILSINVHDNSRLGDAGAAAQNIVVKQGSMPL